LPEEVVKAINAGWARVRGEVIEVLALVGVLKCEYLARYNFERNASGLSKQQRILVTISKKIALVLTLSSGMKPCADEGITTLL
jgi:hypothetical protein